MKALLRFLRLMIALMIGQMALIFLFFIITGALLAARQAPPVLQPRTLLRITLSGEIIEYSTLPEVPLLRRRVLTQTDILEALQGAAEDVRIEGLLVDLDSPQMGWGKAFELHQAILEFRESGKPTWAWGAALEEIDLYIASACDSLFTPPTGIVFANGFGFGGMYLKGTFDLLGIRPNFSRIGEYKSAPETFTHEHMSPAARQENEWLLDDLWNEFTDTIIARRQLDGQGFSEVLRRGMLSAQEAIDLGLIDGKRHLAQLLSLYTDNAGVAQWVSVLDYRRDQEQDPPPDGTTIAVIHTRGMILRGVNGYHPSYGTILGATSVLNDIETAVLDDDVAAIILRIDSGGGDIIASDMIRNAVQQARTHKPIVVSMVDVAASGGYMMAYPANRILAMPTSITGSIGSFIGKFNLQGLYEKIGVTKDFVTRGEYPLLWSDYTDWSAAEESLIARYQWGTYRQWTSDIAKARGLTASVVDSLGRGRVWTGRQAFQNGLVDELGTMQDAIAVTLELLLLPASKATHLVHYPRPRGLLDLLFDDSELFLGAIRQSLQESRILPKNHLWSRLDLQVSR